MKTDDSERRIVTIRDIARSAGVSHTTVSLALRNNSRISEKQRLRIQKVAAKMGYRPDPMLSALSNYRLKNQPHPVRAALAWLNPWHNPKQLRSYHEFDLYWKGASETAFKLGYHLEEFPMQEIPIQRLEQVLMARNIQGILIPPVRGKVDWGGFDWSHFCVIRFGRIKKFPKMHFVTSAQAQNAMLAFDKIRSKGYKRIGFVGIREYKQTFGAGFLWAQQELPPRQRLPLLLLEPSATSRARREALREWVGKNKPDALFTTEKELPGALASMSYRIPEDIALAASSVIDIPIDAGINQNSEEIGRIATLSLISLINDMARGIPSIQHEYLVEGCWVDGKSLPDRSVLGSEYQR